MFNLIHKALNVKPEEQHQVMLLLGFGFFMGIFLATFQISAETLFVTKLGEDAVSLGIFSAGLAGVFTTTIFVYLQNKLKYSVLSFLNLTVLFLVTIGLYIAFKIVPEEYTKQLAFIHFTLMGPSFAIFLLNFWGIFGRIFDLRQSKRIIGGIDTGQLFAAIITFFIVGSGLLILPQTYDFLLIGALSIFGSIVFLTVILKEYNLESVLTGTENKKTVAVRELFKNRYVVLLALFITFSVFAFLLVENSYISVLTIQYPDTVEGKTQLTQFLGWFNGAILILSFIFQTFFNDKIIADYGLKISLMILPIILGVITLLIIVTSYILGFDVNSSGFYIFFVFIAISKLFVSFLREALENPTFKIYFMTLKSNIRFDIQTKIEGVVNELAKALTAGLILIVGLLTFFELIHFYYLIVLVVVGWIILAGKLYAEYRNRLRENLESKQINIEEIDVLYESVISTVQNNLLNDEPAMAVFSFKLLEKINPNYVNNSLNILMRHSKVIVRDFAQEKMNAIKGLSVSDKYIVASKEKDVEDGRNKLSSLDLLNLLSSGDISVKRIAALCKSEYEQDRQYGAELIGNMESDRAVFYLVELLTDFDFKVRIAAIKSSEKKYSYEILMTLIDNLTSSRFSNFAKSALVRIGQDALRPLDNSFHKSGQDAKLMAKLVQLMGRIGGDDAIQMLWAKVDYPDKIISSQVIISLSEAGFKADIGQMTRIKYAIESDIGDIAWNLAASLEIPKDKYSSYLSESLYEENVNDIKHIYTLLSMLYDPASIHLVKQNLESGTSEGITLAIEMLDVLLSEDLKNKIIPVLDDISTAEKVKKLEPYYPRVELTSMQVLKFLLNRDFTQSNRWTKCCVLYHMGSLKKKIFENDIIANLFNPDDMIRQMAAWALYQLDEKLFFEHIIRLDKDFQELCDKRLAAKRKLGLGALVFEKALFLKSMYIFSKVSSLDLSYMADSMVRIKVDIGDTLSLGRELANSFIIVVTGNLSYYQEDEVKTNIKAGEFIGELVLSDTALESAMVVANQNTELYIIDKDLWHDLLADNINFAQSVFSNLTA
jgi:HEAT repeat protein